MEILIKIAAVCLMVMFLIRQAAWASDNLSENWMGVFCLTEIILLFSSIAIIIKW